MTESELLDATFNSATLYSANARCYGLKAEGQVRYEQHALTHDGTGAAEAGEAGSPLEAFYIGSQVSACNNSVESPEDPALSDVSSLESRATTVLGPGTFPGPLPGALPGATLKEIYKGTRRVARGTIPAVVDALRSPDEDIRRKAIRLMGASTALEREPYLQIIFHASLHDNSEFHASALGVIRELTRMEREPYIQMIADAMGDEGLRKRALEGWNACSDAERNLYRCMMAQHTPATDWRRCQCTLQ